MIISGLKFGMMLQLAIGPISVYVFNLAMKFGFLNALTGAVGVVIGDGLCIALAIVGVGNAIEHSSNTKKYMGLIGGIVLIVFGVMMVGQNQIDMAFNESINTSFGTLLKTFLMTVSSPMTIIFWGGVFATKLAEDRYEKVDMIWFGIGSVLSTVVFMTLMAYVGSQIRTFVPPVVTMVLNSLVGILLMAYGLKMLMKIMKENNNE